MAMRKGNKSDLNINYSIKELDPSRFPGHIAIIMDGNGRWAKKKGLLRIQGHRAGVKTVIKTVEFCSDIGIKALTLYTFSSENWVRPRGEVNALMRLLKKYLIKELDRLVRKNVRLLVIGRINELPKFVQTELRNVCMKTSHNNGLKLTLALNYGGRQEIVDAVNKILSESPKTRKIDEETFSRHLYTTGVPDPDLLIRTSGEMRISNFLLWQIAYTEIWVTPVLWPDFTGNHLIEALLDYQNRERRFGGVGK